MKCACVHVISPCIAVLGSTTSEAIRQNRACTHADTHTHTLFNWQRDYEIYSFAPQRINYAGWTPAAPVCFPNYTGWAPIFVTT